MEKSGINFELLAAVEYKGNIYFSGIHASGLYRMDMETGEVEYLALFEKEKDSHVLHKYAYRYGKEAWFIPYMGEYIVCVDLETLVMQYYPIPYFNISNKSEIYPAAYFSSGKFDDNKLYLVPMKYDTVVIIDMRKRTIIPYYNVIDVKREVMVSGTIVDHELWMCPYIGNRIIRLDLENGNIKYCDWNYQFDDYYGMLYHNGQIWFAPHKANCILYLTLETMQFHTLPLGDLYNEQYMYGEVKYFDEKIWILPLISSRLLYWDCKSEKLQSIDNKEKMCQIKPTGFSRVDSENKFIIVSGETCYLSIYDKECQSFNNIRSYMLEKNWGKVIGKKYANLLELKEYLGDGYVIYERYFGLKNFMEYCTKNVDKGYGEQKRDKGLDIWESLKSL